jgi:hypothetical protein
VPVRPARAAGLDERVTDRSGLRAALVALVALAASAGAWPAAAATGGSAPDGRPMVFSGTGSLEAGVVFDALGDHLHLGICSGHDPVSMFDSFTAYLVEVPTPLLGGNLECGKRVAVSNTAGRSVIATIVGSCGSCSGSNLALSPALYARLISMDQHDTTIPLTWKFAG